jgi:hypothetical protein
MLLAAERLSRRGNGNRAKATHRLRPLPQGSWTIYPMEGYKVEAPRDATTAVTLVIKTLQEEV